MSPFPEAKIIIWGSWPCKRNINKTIIKLKSLHKIFDDNNTRQQQQIHSRESRATGAEKAGILNKHNTYP